MKRPAPSDRASWTAIAAMAAAASMVAAVFLVLILWVVWPGAMAHAAPLACPAGFPDPFVLEEVYSLPGETRWTWSLVCMSAHGAIFRPGSTIPWALGVAILWLPCMVIALAVVHARMKR
ncbi:hypothetical protein [Lysobacter sp. A378]